MDTMFTLFQQYHSSISTTTGHHQPPPQQCHFSSANFFIQEAADQENPSSSSSSSSSMQPYSSYPPPSSPLSHHHFSTSTATTPPPPPSKSNYHDQNIYCSIQDDVAMEFSDSFAASATWASDILPEAARAVAESNTSRLQHLMWMLNELSSPYGDVDEKLSFYFLQALLSRMTNSGDLSYRSLSSVSEKMCTFESTRNLVLKFQEVSPWMTFGHVASNGAIMEAFDGEAKLHIVDFSNTYCTQWPTLLEAIATRTDETPHLRLTTVISATSGGSDGIEKVMREIGNRIEKFARLMGVPFKFNVIHHTGDISYLDFNQVGIQSDEALAINLNGTLRSVRNQRREHLMSMLRSVNPKIVTIVEEESDMDVGIDGCEFLRGFEECLRWFRVYFEALDESFPKTSNERLMLEREAGRAVMDLVACSPEKSVHRRESAERWSSKLRGSGFVGVSYNEESCDDVRALVRRYREGWSMAPPSSETASGIYLMRKETAVVWASAWKPI